MKNYSRVLKDSIEREKSGTDYFCTEEDKALLNELCKEINKCMGTDFHYLAELDTFNIPGAGEIIAKYITKFSSEGVRSYLAPQMAADRIKDCDKLILQLYLHFKSSDKYIAKPGETAPAHIYVRYDNALWQLKPKRLKKDLLQLAYNPRDVHYLPFTMRMLASWKIPEMKELLINYAKADSFTPQDVGIYDCEKPFYPPFDFIKREVTFTAIDGLKYYPSVETFEILSSFAAGKDKDIRAKALKTIAALTKNGVVDFLKEK